MIRQALQVASAVTLGIVMGLSLAHALELPGKRRLNREQYLAVQAIYYPGFTMGGIAEPLSILLLTALMLWTRASPLPLFLQIGALTGAIAVQLIFWIRTQPVNRYWLEHTRTGGPARVFFGSAASQQAPLDWTVLRDRWEHSHVWRAVLATVAFVLLMTALSIEGPQPRAPGSCVRAGSTVILHSRELFPMPSLPSRAVNPLSFAAHASCPTYQGSRQPCLRRHISFA